MEESRTTKTSNGLKTTVYRKSTHRTLPNLPFEPLTINEQSNHQNIYWLAQIICRAPCGLRHSCWRGTYYGINIQNTWNPKPLNSTWFRKQHHSHKHIKTHTHKKNDFTLPKRIFRKLRRIGKLISDQHRCQKRKPQYRMGTNSNYLHTERLVQKKTHTSNICGWELLQMALRITSQVITDTWCSSTALIIRV